MKYNQIGAFTVSCGGKELCDDKLHFKNHKRERMLLNLQRLEHERS